MGKIAKRDKWGGVSFLARAQARTSGKARELVTANKERLVRGADAWHFLEVSRDLFF